MKVKVGQSLYFAQLDASNPQLVQVEVIEVADAATREGGRIVLAPTRIIIGNKLDITGHFIIYDGDNWTRLFKDVGKAKQALIKMAIKEEKSIEKQKAEDRRTTDRDYKFNVRGIEKDYAGAVKDVRKLLSKLQA